MKMEIDSKLVDRGFFPHFVGDVEQFAESMDWEVDTPKGEKMVGMYFEFSGLPKGGHSWSFWLKMNNKKQLDSTCPVPVESKLFKIP
jgi:hypothetical protein